ncbi:MAG: hypothetical protein GQF41_1930 [Candidatus Rifleibacterium amylolyticum]|nr:MAG: hypothetical protein GQF41_1930 [Candidatus Rifleibacterium amylolyticum]
MKARSQPPTGSRRRKESKKVSDAIRNPHHRSKHRDEINRTPARNASWGY